MTIGDDPDTSSVNTLLKGMQPYREKPSKDRSRCFATGDLPFNSDTPESHDVQVFQYWIVFPTNKLMRAAKVFLLGQVIYLSESSKPVRSLIKVNANLSAVLNVYKYQADSSVYTPHYKYTFVILTNFVAATDCYVSIHCVVVTIESYANTLFVNLASSMCSININMCCSNINLSVTKNRL